MAVGRAHRMLRASCQAAHAALEDRLPFADAGLRLPAYIQLLQKFYRALVPLEASLRPFAAALRHDDYDLQPCLKTHLIERDLAALGALPAQQGGASALAPPVRTLSQSLGRLYVLEGSSLGGQVIARRLQNTLNLTPSRGCAYFFGSGERTAERWKSTCALLERLLRDDGAIADAASAATATFAYLEQELAR